MILIGTTSHFAYQNYKLRKQSSRLQPKATATPAVFPQPTSSPTNNEKTPSLQACINAWNEKALGNYARGEIIVGFEDGLSEAEASEIIKSFGLDLVLIIPEFHGTGHIRVTPGIEFEWLCKLEQHPKIKFANPSPIYSTE